MDAIQAILRSLPDAAAIGALLAVIIGSGEIKIRGFTARGDKLIGLSCFFVLLIILTGKSFFEYHQHEVAIDKIEQKIAYLIAGNPLSFEQIEDHFYKENGADVEEALERMVHADSARTSLTDAAPKGADGTVQTEGRLIIRVRLFTLASD